MREALLAAAAVAVALAVGDSHGNLSEVALVLVLAATAATATAVALPRREDRARWRTPVILGAGIAAGIWHDLLRSPGWQVSHDSIPAFRPVLLVAAAVAASHLWRGAPAWVTRLRPALLALPWVGLVAILFHAFPSPAIDVWDLQQGAVAGLLHGENPYALAYPNRYGPGTALLSPAVLSADGTRILAFPYPPLTILVGLAGAPLGDVRWAHVGLTVLSAAGIWQLGGRTRRAELAATFVLYQPSAVFLVEQAWTEPLVLACLVGLALAVRGEPVRQSVRGAPAASPVRGELVPQAVRGEPVEPRGRTRPSLAPVLAGLAAGLALAAKQYTPLLLLPFLAAMPARDRIRAVAVAAGVAAAIYLPFAIWDPRALWRGLVTFHVAQPFRPDSLSLAAALHRLGITLPAWPAFLAAGAVVAIAWRRIRGVFDALAVASLAWLAFLLLAKQAFANYYLLAVGLLCAAAVAPRPGDPADPAAEPAIR